MGGPAKRVLDILLLGTACQTLAGRLRQDGHRVFPVSRAEAAVTMLSARPFDMIVAASQPADIDLSEALRRLRAGTDACAAVTPLVARDASGDDGDRLRAAGADYIFTDDDSLGRLTTIAVSSGVDDLDPQAGVASAETSEGRTLLELLRETLRRQLSALDSADFRPEHLTDIAHRLKGSAANFGYAALGAAAAEAMRLPAQSRRAAAATTLLRLEIETAIGDIDRRLATKRQ
jgi:HPt (histidine-containing phosphotransfer) domain-containing protein